MPAYITGVQRTGVGVVAVGIGSTLGHKTRGVVHLNTSQDGVTQSDLTKRTRVAVGVGLASGRSAVGDLDMLADTRFVANIGGALVVVVTFVCGNTKTFFAFR